MAFARDSEKAWAGIDADIADLFRQRGAQYTSATADIENRFPRTRLQKVQYRRNGKFAMVIAAFFTCPLGVPLGNRIPTRRCCGRPRRCRSMCGRCSSMWNMVLILAVLAGQGRIPPSVFLRKTTQKSHGLPWPRERNATLWNRFTRCFGRSREYQAWLRWSGVLSGVLSSLHSPFLSSRCLYDSQIYCRSQRQRLIR